MTGENFSRGLYFSADGLESYNFSTNDSVSNKSINLSEKRTSDSISGEKYYDIRCGEFQLLDNCGNLEIEFVPENPGIYQNKVNISTAKGNRIFDFERTVYGRQRFNLSLDEKRKIILENDLYNTSRKFTGGRKFEIPEKIDGDSFKWNLSSSPDNSSLEIIAANIKIQDSINLSTKYKENAEKGNKLFYGVLESSIKQKDNYDTRINADTNESVFVCSNYSGDCKSGWNETNSSEFGKTIEAVAIGEENSKINLSLNDFRINSQALITTNSSANLTIKGDNYTINKKTNEIKLIKQKKGLEEKETFDTDEWEYSRISKFGNRSVSVSSEQEKSLTLNIAREPENISFWYRGELKTSGLRKNIVDDSRDWKKFSSGITDIDNVSFSSTGAAIDQIKTGNITNVNGTYFTPRKNSKIEINATKTVNGELFNFQSKTIRPENSNFIKIISNKTKGLIKNRTVNRTVYFASGNLTGYNKSVNISTDDENVSLDIEKAKDQEKTRITPQPDAWHSNQLNNVMNWYSVTGRRNQD